MYTLGINAAYHDSAACIVKDGRVLAAAEEERFTHFKHGKRPIPFSAYELPHHAVDFCLAQAGIELYDLDHVAYSYNPYLLMNGNGNGHASGDAWRSPHEPLFLSSIVGAPGQLVDGVPHHLSRRFSKRASEPPYRWHFVEHHLAHAASAFFACPFESCAVLTLDGRGEKVTTSYSAGRGDRLERLGQVEMPHSLGLLYEELTSYLGFLHSSDEYKVMALASYGRPVHAHRFRDLVRILPEGRYEIREHDLERMFGPARRRGEAFEDRHFDLARSLQLVLEESALELARWLHGRTGESDLCLAGGVALNCVMNARIRDKGPFRRVWVQPAAGDSGTALGAALWIDSVYRRPSDPGRRWVMDHAFLGPEFSEERIEEFLRWSKQPYRRLADVPAETARLLAEDNIVGWFQGRMEFGPRALGARSILASPINPEMQARLNEIKDREDFRPVAPAVLEEEAGEWFENAGRSPFMLFVYDVKPGRAGRIPAVRHVDGTARVQTVNESQNPPYYRLLREFKRATGVPVLVNTSFNIRGKPIVCSPQDATDCFWNSPLDALVIGPFLLEK